MSIKYLWKEVFGDGWCSSIDWEQFDYTSEAFNNLGAYDEIIATMMEPYKSIIDVGCGNGRALAYYSEKLNAYSVTGVDESVQACQAVIDRDIKAYNMSGDQFLELALRDHMKCDYMTFGASLEHMRDPQDVLRKATQIADHVIFSIPNVGFFLDRFRLMFGGRFCCQAGDHIRFWTTKDVKYWVKKEGYVLEDIRYRFKPRWDWCLTKLWPNLFARMMVVKIRRG